MKALWLFLLVGWSAVYFGGLYLIGRVAPVGWSDGSGGVNQGVSFEYVVKLLAPWAIPIFIFGLLVAVLGSAQKRDKRRRQKSERLLTPRE